MNTDFAVEKTIRERRSIRTYEEKALSPAEKEKILAYIRGLSNPFSVSVHVHMVDKDSAAKGEKLGTYGMIRGARTFIGASVLPGTLALEALGYTFEKLVLYCTSLGLGTCWLGGSFNRSGFAAAMGVAEEALLPIVSPVGYPAEKVRAIDAFIRKTAGSDLRYQWDVLYFKDNFSNPLAREEAGPYAYPLDMMRLAPSAVNKQPWRVVMAHGAFHFYRASSSVGTKPGGVNLQQVDMGIAACHFHLAALEKSLPGQFERLEEPAIIPPKNAVYVFSWIKD